MPTLEEQAFCLAAPDLRTTLINPQKAGPDNIPGRVPRDCGDQLAGVLTDIFNIFLSQIVVPASFKKTTFVLVPNKSTVMCQLPPSSTDSHHNELFRASG